MILKRPFTDIDWLQTPEMVRQYILHLERTTTLMQGQLESHEKRLEVLETRAQKRSHNSDKPPSSDPPFTKKKRKQEKSAKPKGGQKGHQGHQQSLLEPTDIQYVMPERCGCGHSTFDPQTAVPFYVHQHIELPKIEMKVTHYHLHQYVCPQCGRTIKSTLPLDKTTGYGPRFTAFVGELSGIKAMSREDVRQLCSSVLDVPIANGTIQKLVDRTSQAIAPIYEHIGQIARRAWCNHIDETPWFHENNLHWLWTMANDRVGFYRIDSRRSKEAFEKLIADWDGILVSDSYGLYRKWVNRQTCLAHLIRKADALLERKSPDLRHFGHLVGSRLRQLVSFAKDRPDLKQWSEFSTYLSFTISLWECDTTDAGKLARQIKREMENLWTFLDNQGVDPTNNRAERALRFGVLWRKRSLGTQSEKGNRWVERILSLRETCRIKAKSTFEVLTDCIRSYFQKSPPDLSWV